MRRWRNRVSWFFIVGGVFFLLKGGASLYFFARTPDSLPANQSGGLGLVENAAPMVLRIPRLATFLPILEGVTESELRRGPGHLPGTPIPGTLGNSVIAGHRDTHFRMLKNIRKGDEIVIEQGSRKVAYKVRETRIVKPTDTSVLKPTRTKTLTLITCYPFRFIGSAPERFIVTAIAD
jgi:sortase A